MQYLVALDGYGPEENCWERVEMFEGTAMQALVNFHDRDASKPRDHRVIDVPMRGKKIRRKVLRTDLEKRGVV